MATYDQLSRTNRMREEKILKILGIDPKNVLSGSVALETNYNTLGGTVTWRCAKQVSNEQLSELWNLTDG